MWGDQEVPGLEAAPRTDRGPQNILVRALEHAAKNDSLNISKTKRWVTVQFLSITLLVGGWPQGCGSGSAWIRIYFLFWIRIQEGHLIKKNEKKSRKLVGTELLLIKIK